MKIGVLTGGGDCPGLNAAIRAIVKYGSKRYEDRFLGIKYGWKGLVNKSMPIEERVMELTPVTVSGILTKGGTILYSSRTNPLSQENGLEDLRHNFDELGLNGLIAIDHRGHGEKYWLDCTSRRYGQRSGYHSNSRASTVDRRDL